ncbi:type III restriction endonuclease subunit R [Zobellella denitrificans]|uniref:DEAD/DEAH box helicase n=1 Tax=Zobellella denitrificans TaxID=347534 RepID=UPI000B8C27CC|nr:DEAD/DEAH box helicase [Zobellella denitrificans]OXS15301.1 type III restriction endonuclease subunit R [Zobellella denitrificans]
MSCKTWGLLSASQVGEWINFDRNNASWLYHHTDNSMAAKQAEGVAGLWNNLATKELALLADEVGMGKTFQALGVMALLWKMKPDARVLVMAPNRDICRHWMREYNTFLREHYRDRDHLVRNMVDGGPIHHPRLCANLFELVEQLSLHTCRFFLTTIHSLSGLVPDKEKEEGDKRKKARSAAEQLYQKVKSLIGDDGFDLLIIDEAHYFRNKHGGSQRVAAAEAFFGENDNKLAQRTLLMTATPSHSSPADLSNILGYFANLDDSCSETDALMREFGIRRLRHMQGREQAHNKYNYRSENAVASSFAGNLDAELFFALYQKKLVESQGETGGNRRFLYGYLEGFESVGNTATSIPPEDDANDEGVRDSNATDFGSRVADSQLLSRLTEQFHGIYNRFPDHPKYGTLVTDCVPKDIFCTSGALHDDKHLVFVRRIPSVREITQRINAEYDEQLASKLIKAWSAEATIATLDEWRKLGWSRAFFNRFVEQQQSVRPTGELGSLEETDDEDNASEESELKLSSKIFDLFTVKKSGEKRTDCTNVSLRFRRPESLFSLFLEPASDYIKGKYDAYGRKVINGRERDLYGDVARDMRLDCHELFSRKSQKEYRGDLERRRYDLPVTTAWGEMYGLLPETCKDQLKDWKERNPAILENLGNYLKSGFMFASPVVIELYCWFTVFSRVDQAKDIQKKYHAFTEWVRPRLPESLMYRYFINAIETFEAMCEKITDHRLTDWERPWRELTSLHNPAWFASGETSNRQRLILGFNSPFFPNVLVATSVFQEGVNLHLQCHKVHHYGIAWTPGDNEQRVGRVDRLFGKVNQMLRDSDRATLHINYPYLDKSFDQEQLASFIRLKHGVEAKLDACDFHQFSSEIDLKNAMAGWQEFLRKPDYSTKVKDPYPAKSNNDHASFLYTPCNHIKTTEVESLIGRRLQHLAETQSATLHKINANNHHPNALFLIESQLVNKTLLQHQPVILERHFSSEFSALVSGTVYYLSFKSPLASRDTLKKIDGAGPKELTALANRILKHYPLVKLVVDFEHANSHFYLHTRVDLPLFVLGEDAHMLSDYEMEMAYKQVIKATDAIEFGLFNGSQDLKKDDLTINQHSEGTGLAAVEFDAVTSAVVGEKWHKVDGEAGEIALLSACIDLNGLSKLADNYGMHAKNTPEMQALQLNHFLPMINCTRSEETTKLELGYPAGDLQEKERELLERWFETIVSIAL